MSQKRAVCRMPVELYDTGFTRLYVPGDELVGDPASFVLDKYPDYFADADAQESAAAADKPARRSKVGA